MSTNSFDERAATWDDDPAKVERADAVAAAISGAISLDRSMRMLEYGAGTGLVTQALRKSVGPVTLADTSIGMRAVIQDKIDAGAIDDARVWDLDLATQPAPDERFDLIVTVMTLHHITKCTPRCRASRSCWSTADISVWSTSTKRTGRSTAPTSRATTGSSVRGCHPISPAPASPRSPFVTVMMSSVGV